MAEAKRQKVAALLHVGLSVADICRTLAVSEWLSFKIKKLIKDGKISRSFGQEARR
jgi:hypothetical protein